MADATEEELQYGDLMCEIAGRHVHGDHGLCHPMVCPTSKALPAGKREIE